MSHRGEMGHLVRRFTGSLSRAEPPAADVAWLEALLSPAERRHLGEMSRPDRRHAVESARRAEALLGDQATTELIVASALHDVGKTDACLGTVGRVVATVCGRLASGHRVRAWLSDDGARRAIAAYLLHDVRGAETLAAGGSAPVVVAWAAEHHRPEAEWSVPAEIGRALAEADQVSPLEP